MKIFYLYTALTTVGGVDRIVIQKANYLAEQGGHDVYIITDSQEGRPTVFPLSPKVKHIDTNINFGKQYKYPFILRAFYYWTAMKKYRYALEKILKGIQPDIVISTLGRDTDFLTQLKDGSYKIGEAHTTRANLRKIQELLTQGGFHRIAGLRLKRRMEKTVKKLDALVVLNPMEKQQWQNVRKAVVIPNFLPFELPTSTAPLSSATALCIGRIEWEKGTDRLIEVWQIVSQSHPEWILNIYGNGTQKEYISQEIGKRQLNQYIYLHPSHRSPEVLYLQNSMLIMTSRFEGFGLVLIEAMACGVPCIAYNCPFGPQSIIKDGINGFLIEDGNKEDMAKKINSLIENEKLRKKMGQQAILTARQYTQKKVMAQWDALFNSLIK